MPPKRNSLKLPWRRNSTHNSYFDANRLSGTYICVTIQKFQRNRTIRGRLMAILPFYSFGRILGPKSGKRFSELENLPHPVGTMRYGHHRCLSSFFTFPKKSSNSKNDGAPKTSGVEILVKIWDFLPPVKNNGGVKKFSIDFYEVQPEPPPTA